MAKAEAADAAEVPDGMSIPDELTRCVEDGAVTVLDVRPSDKFEAGHLPRAINIPLRELSRRLREIPKSREVVAYCRGPYCKHMFLLAEVGCIGTEGGVRGPLDRICRWRGLARPR